MIPEVHYGESEISTYILHYYVASFFKQLQEWHSGLHSQRKTLSPTNPKKLSPTRRGKSQNLSLAIIILQLKNYLKI
jgi:hypothetical protein